MSVLRLRITVIAYRLNKEQRLKNGAMSLDVILFAYSYPCGQAISVLKQGFLMKSNPFNAIDFPWGNPLRR